MKTIITIEHASKDALERSLLWKAIMAHFATGYDRNVSIIKIEAVGPVALVTAQPPKRGEGQ